MNFLFAISLLSYYIFLKNKYLHNITINSNKTNIFYEIIFEKDKYLYENNDVLFINENNDVLFINENNDVLFINENNNVLFINENKYNIIDLIILLFNPII